MYAFHQFCDVLPFVDPVKYFVDRESASVRSATWYFFELVGVRIEEDQLIIEWYECNNLLGHTKSPIN